MNGGTLRRIEHSDRFGLPHKTQESYQNRGGSGMIWLTGLSGETFVLNAELIEMIEARPDTTITLVNGRKYIVRESIEDVIQKVLEYKRKIFEKVSGV